LTELIIREACVAHDVPHGDRVDGIMPWDAEDPRPIGHYDVFTLANDPEAYLLQCSNGIKMLDAWQPGHG
jgi:hypothetical protein